MQFRYFFLAFVGCLVVGCNRPCTEYTPSGAPALSFEVRRAAFQPVGSWEQHDFDGRSLYLSPELELQNSDLLSTGVRKSDDGDWQVVLRLNEAAKSRFGESSVQLSRMNNQGPGVPRRGYLAVVIDRRVVCVPAVNAPMTDGVIPLTVEIDFTEQEARRVARGLVSK